MFPGDRIVEELPTYVSGKLGELIEANRLYWRGYQSIDTSEKERRRSEFLNHLKEDFSQLCDKKSNNKTLVAFAATICDPTLLPESRRLHSTSVTPAMLALLTAAKLFWSAHCQGSQTYETYPNREAVIEFLRFMGLREADAASSGTTLIRPESARTPEPEKDWQTTMILRRQGVDAHLKLTRAARLKLTHPLEGFEGISCRLG